MSVATHNASRRRPPGTDNRNVVALTAANATSAIATGATANDCWISIVCSAAFDVNFGVSTVAAPTDTGVFAAGIAHEFECGKFDTHFRVMPNANGNMLWWRSSRS